MKSPQDLENELTVLPGRYGEGELVWNGHVDMYTVLYLKWITSKDMYNTWNSAQCYVAARMRGESRGEWIHVLIHVWLSAFTVHLKQ